MTARTTTRSVLRLVELALDPRADVARALDLRQPLVEHEPGDADRGREFRLQDVGLAGAYRFVHDRVLETAYSVIPEASRAAAHLRVGRLLLGRTPPEKREEAVFDIVNQLNRGAALITSQDEREQLAELNLIAGKRAKASTAHASALAYLIAGTALLAADCWERRHDLVFSLELLRAECEFLTGALGVAEERLKLISTRAATTVERASIVCLLLDLYTTLGQSTRALAVGLEYLRDLGVEWPAAPTDENVQREYERFWSQLGRRTIEDLIDLPLMTNPVSLATMDVLTKMVSPASLAGGNLYPLAMCWAVNLSLEQGNSDGSCATYVQFGCVAGTHFGDHVSAYRFGRLGCELVARRGLTRFEGRIYLVAGCHLIPYKEPLRAARNLLRRGFEVTNRSGDLMYMLWYRCFYLIENLLVAGDSLVEVQREAEYGLAYARQMQYGPGIDLAGSYLALVRTLRGLTSKFGSFNDKQFDEAGIEAYLASNPNFAFAECRYHLRKLQAHFHAGDFAAAIKAASSAERLQHSILRLLFTAPEYCFYSALSHAAYWDCAAIDVRLQHLDAVAAHHKQLQIWAENCPENFENLAALVGAELARLRGRDGDAMRLYEEAARSARDNGFMHNEALANELASRFYAGLGLEKVARLYLRDARSCYLRWGADGKVRQLDEKFPDLRTEAPMPGPTSTIGAPVEYLDFAAVIQVSQAVSAEIVWEKLIDRLLRAAIQYAGAERGVLILSDRAGGRVAAEATAGEIVDVHILEQPIGDIAMAESIVHYAERTRESVILDDASAENQFSADAYIRQRNVRSVLCLPLITQNKLAGVLYLENNLAPRVFTPGRIAVLQVLASQAAISVENSRLYRDLEERESKIRGLVEANIIGITVWNLDGEITDANDAFLRIVGYTREELLGGRVSWMELTPPDWRVRHAQALAQFKATGAIQPYEREYVRKDGSRVSVLVGSAGFGERRNQGVSFVLDLSERKRAEQALRDSEEQWRAVFENNPTMYFMIDAAGTIVSVNPCGAEQLGYRVAELVGHPVVAIFHEADRPAVMENVAICFQQLGRTISWELRKVRRDGTIIWVRETAGAMLIKQQPTLLIVCEDISERKRAEHLTRQWFDSSPNGVAIIGRDYRYRRVNPVFAHYWGITPERVAGVHVADLRGEEDFEQVVKPRLDRCFAEDAQERRYAGWANPPIGRRYGIATYTPLRPHSDQVEAALVINNDITEYELAAEGLREAQAELAHMNRVTTMGQLTATIAHEVNQPIAAAVTNASAALRWLGAQPPDLAEVRQALGRILENGYRAGEVIGRIRALIKKAPPRRDGVAINDAILEVIALTHGEAMKTGVSVRTQLAEGLPPIEGDRVQLQQVILNLVINAIEAMSGVLEAPRELLLSTERDEPDAVHVAVRDSGPGMAPAALEQLFDAFYTTKPSGLGLGLSICRSIIESHDGRLWASANVPRGAIFEFTLPARPGRGS